MEKVKGIVPRTALTKQDRLHQMKKRKDESWSEFLDRYSIYAHTCEQVEDRQKIAELYQKLPKEIRNMLVFMPADISFADMLKNMAHLRYWQSYTNEANSLVDPMDVNHIQEEEGRKDDPWEKLEEGCAIGEGRLCRLILRGNSINFKNIDSPRSLMVAWKKLVGTSGPYQREAQQYLQGRAMGGDRGGGCLDEDVLRGDPVEGKDSPRI